MLKVVVDTSVLIAGLLKNSTCRKIINHIKNTKFTLIISPSIFEELVDVMARPKFHNVISEDIAHQLIEVIKTQAVIVTPRTKVSLIKDDPDDDQFIEAAIEAKANMIVSVDNHLLNLKDFPIPIVTPAEFLKRLTNLENK